jgi:hypothetical protein
MQPHGEPVLSPDKCRRLLLLTNGGYTMTKFNVKLLGPCNVAEAVHESFTIHNIEGQHVASGLNVELPDGERFIRVFDYNPPLKAALDEYFSSRTRVSEVTFSRPFDG